MPLYNAVSEAFFQGRSRRGVEVYVDAKALASGTATFTTPFRTIHGVIATIVNGSAPGLNTSTLTYSVSGKTVTVLGWRPTSSTNPTLIATTSTETVSVVVFGTR